jgi:hypothetical protein
MKVKISKHYEETWADKEAAYSEKIAFQEVRGTLAFASHKP